VVSVGWRVKREKRLMWMWDREVVISEEERWWAARIREDIGIYLAK